MWEGISITNITISLQITNQSNAPAREGREVGALGWLDTWNDWQKEPWETKGLQLPFPETQPAVGLWGWCPETAEVGHLREHLRAERPENKRRCPTTITPIHSFTPKL